MFRLKVTASFDSAHFLSGYSGKCANIHGHRWVIEAQLEGKEIAESGEKRGMLEDFGDVKRALSRIADEYDHALIYEEGTLRPATVRALEDQDFRLVCVPFRPTAELFAKDIYFRLKAEGFPVKSVTVRETPENAAVYEEDR